MAKNIEINIKGSDGNYEVLYPKTNSSTTVINQDIINQFGLADGSGLEDVLGELGKYNEYWWRRRVAGEEKYVEIKTDITANKVFILGSFDYGHNITINQNDGTYTIVKEGKYTINSWDSFLSAMQDLSSKLPCYVYGGDYLSSNYKWYYIPENANWDTSSGSNYGTFCYYNYYDDGYSCCLSGYASVKAQIFFTQKVIQLAGEWEYLYSLNRNAYPNSGIQDGYEYEYLGVPYQQMSQTPNGILIGTFQINKTAFGGTKLFDSTEIEAGCGYYFTVDYDIAWTNNSGKSMQIGLMITSESSRTIFDTSEGFCYNVSYGYQTTTGQEQGSSRIYYVNNVKDIFLCLHADTSAYDCNFLSTGIYFNFAGPNLTTSQLNNITISKANFTINVYKQVLC